MPRLLLTLALLLPLCALAELDISDARIKNLPPTVPLRAGYLTLHNPRPVAVSVVAVHSAAFASIEIHRSVMQDGMMRMQPVPQLEIGAGETLRLAPGGLHLMMLQPIAATRPGDEIEIVLRLGDGFEQKLTMKVVR